VDAFAALYEPNAYIDRVYSYFLKLPPQKYKQFVIAENRKEPLGIDWTDLRALATVVWRQGFKRDTRFRFWRALAGMALHNPKRFKGFVSILAHNEHFLEYRAIVRQEIQGQLANLPPELPQPAIAAKLEYQPA
jgi:hypothetical protein